MALCLVGAAASGCGIFGGNDDDYEPYQPEPAPPEELFTEECVPDAWWAEADAAGVPGLPATIDLQGSEVRIDGQASFDVLTGELWMHGDDPESIVVFDGVTVGDEDQGTLVVRGELVHFSDGTLLPQGAASVDLSGPRVRADLGVDFLGGPPPSLGDQASAADIGRLAEAVQLDAIVEDARLEGYDEAYVVQDGELLPVSGGVTFSASRTFASSSAVIESQFARLHWEGEAIVGLTPSAGTVLIDDEPLETLPLLLFGTDITLEVGPGHVRSVGTVPLRQAFDDEGPLLPTSVELRACEPDTVVMAAGGQRWLRMSYRQPGTTADALLLDASVIDTETGERWETSLNVDPGVPESIESTLTQYSHTTWGASLGSLIEAFVDVIDGIGRAIGCIFTLFTACSTHEDANDTTYPLWMSAGGVGEFEISLSAPEVPGEYMLELRVDGHGYEAVTPLVVLVY